MDKIACHFCGELVPIKDKKKCHAHFRTHVKEGIADEVKTPSGILLFVKGTGRKRSYE